MTVYSQMAGVRRLERERLYAAFEDPFAPPHLALEAPSGYGKSTLLQQLANRHPSLLIDLSELDGTARGIAWALVDEVAALAPHTAGALTRLLERSEGPVPARAFAAGLATAGPLLVMIDRADHSGSDAQQWVSLLMERLADTQRLILAGRVLDAFELSYQVAEGRLRILDMDTLAFTRDEALSLAEQRGTTLTEAEHLNGWPLGIGLLTAHNSPITPQDLVRRQLQLLPALVRSALPELAVISVWDEHCAQDVPSLPINWLSEAQRAGLPLRSLGGGRFAPHPLLRALLTEDLRRFPERWTLAHRSAACRAVDSGLLTDALDHLLAIGDTEAIVQLTERHVPGLMDRGLYAQATAFLDRIPAGVLPPPLALTYGMALVETRCTSRGLDLLQHVSGQLPDSALSNLLAAYNAYIRADFQAQLSASTAALDSPAGLSDLMVMQMHGTRIHALANLGRHEEAQREAEEACRLARVQGPAESLAYVLFAWAFAAQRAGHFRKAVELLEESLTIYRQLRMHAKTLGPVMLLADVVLDTGDDARAAQLLDQAIEIAEQEQSRWMGCLQQTRGRQLLLQGELREAAAAFECAISAAREAQRPDRIFMSHCLLADTHTKLGEHDRARESLKTASAINSGHQGWKDVPEYNALLAFEHGHLAFAQGDDEDARTWLEVASWYNGLSGVRAHAYLTELARKRGELTENHAATLASRMRGFGEGHTPAAWDVDELGTLYQCFVRRNWSATAFAPWAKSVKNVTSTRIELSGQLIGGPVIRVEHRPLTLEGRQSRLLTALLVRGPQSKDELRQAVFGDDDKDVRDPLKHIRRKLRAVTAVEEPLPYNPESGVYSLADELEPVLDTQRLERAITLGDVATVTALLPVPATVLPHMDGDWIEDLREAVHPVMLQGYLLLGQDAQSRGDNETALTAFEAALDLVDNGSDLDAVLGRIERVLEDQQVGDAAARLMAYRVRALGNL